MAGLIRLGVVRALSSGCRGLGRQGPPRRSINTSSKKTSTGNAASCPPENKNWISYGYSTIDPFIDRLGVHLTAFCTITLGIVLVGYYYVHIPDAGGHEWAQREAYLEIRRREKLGLLPIEPNYYDPATITLPTDEELGDTEIII